MRGKSRVSQANVREVNPAEDVEAQEESLLADCRVHLSRIFVHWEPVLHCSAPRSEQPGDELDHSQLAADTALLLLKCSLRWLVENSPDENTTREFLHWLEKAVVKHGEVINLVMLDFSLKADLLQLFHHTAEVGCHSSFSTKVETLQLFTNVMVRLLEMQGHLPDLYQPVISACVTHHDQSRRGKKQRTYLESLCECEYKQYISTFSSDLYFGNITKLKVKGQTFQLDGVCLNDCRS